MTISSPSLIANLYQGSPQGVGARSQHDFRQLGQALQTDKLGTAQQAFSAFLQPVSGPQPTQTSPQTAGSSGTASPVAALAQALQSGNLSTAQQAFAALQNPQHRLQATGTYKNTSGADGGGSSINVTA